MLPKLSEMAFLDYLFDIMDDVTDPGVLLDMLGSATGWRPRNQVIIWVIDILTQIVLIIALCAATLMVFVVGVPVILGALCILLVLDMMSRPVVFLYCKLVPWVLRKCCGMSGDRNDTASDQLPTTNIIDSAPKPRPKISLPYPLNTTFTMLNEEKSSLNEIPPPMTINYNSGGPMLPVPPPCAQIGSHFRDSSYSQLPLSPPPPYH